MNSNSVHLIATDPPFKKGKDFHATPDSLAAGAKFQDRWSWERDVHPEWLDQIKDDHPSVWEVIDAANAVYIRKTKKNLMRPRDEVGSDMGAFLCFMAVRLLEMHRVLRDDGSLYLHADYTASHYLKGLMDAIFGYKNLRNEIIWCYEIGGRGKKRFASKHDTLLYYAKSKSTGFNADSVRLPRRKTHMKTEFDEDGNEWQVKRDAKTGKIYKYPMDAGALCPDWWTDINQLNRSDPERFGYPTQKPLALYERIVRASSNEGDIVLDPFCGCATTPVVSERLNRQWVGIDIWDKAHDAVITRLGREGLLGNFNLDDIRFTTDLPKRTDDGLEAVSYLRPKEDIKEPKDQFSSNAERKQYLLEQHGPKCQGCNRKFDDPRYLELDHNNPRSQGGWNHIKNRILLCGPCNKAKSDTLTLKGLQRLNKKNGWMATNEKLI